MNNEDQEDFNIKLAQEAGYRDPRCEDCSVKDNPCGQWHIQPALRCERYTPVEKSEDRTKPSNPEEKIRTFDSGATRDTGQGKLDYVKALSPIVLRRYVQYLDKHRLQPDGSFRDFDNWKKGIPQDVYHSGGGRHFFDTWLLTEGYTTEDNHGPVEDIEDTLCAEIFNKMGRLHEIVKARLGKENRTKPVPGGY